MNWKVLQLFLCDFEITWSLEKKKLKYKKQRCEIEKDNATKDGFAISLIHYVGGPWLAEEVKSAHLAFSLVTVL